MDLLQLEFSTHKDRKAKLSVLSYFCHQYLQMAQEPDEYDAAVDVDRNPYAAYSNAHLLKTPNFLRCRRAPKFNPGSIVRIRLKDFLTYAYVEMDCGPVRRRFPRSFFKL